MKYKIKQIKNRNANYLFMDYNFALENDFNLGDYDVVYEGEIEGTDVDKILDQLFVTFNVNHPEDFRGHSLSVSDIVELDGVNYYCDDIGWEKL